MRTRRAIAETTQIQRRDGVAFELFVRANQFFFQGAAGNPVSSNLPFPKASGDTRASSHSSELDAWVPDRVHSRCHLQ